MKKLISLVLCTALTSTLISGPKYSLSEGQHKEKIKYRVPYESKEELSTVLSYAATACTGLGLLAAGYFLQKPYLMGMGFALFVGGSNDLKAYDEKRIIQQLKENTQVHYKS